MSAKILTSVAWCVLGLQAVDATTNLHRHLHHHKRVRSRTWQDDTPVEPAPEDKQDFKNEETAMKRDSERIHHFVDDVKSGMDNGVGLHRILTKHEVQVKSADERIERFEGQVESIRRAHDVAERRLNDMMMPRIVTSERRLAKKHAEVGKDQAVVHQWEIARDKIQNSLQHTREEKERTTVLLAEAHKEALEALRKEEDLKRTQDMLSERESSEDHTFKVTNTKFMALRADAESSLNDEQIMAASIEKMRSTFNAEADALDRGLAAKEDKFSQKISKAEEEKEKAQKAMAVTQDRFLAWQAEQKRKAHEVTEMKRALEERQRAYAESKRDLAEKKLNKVFDLESDDWAWNL